MQHVRPGEIDQRAQDARERQTLQGDRRLAQPDRRPQPVDQRADMQPNVWQQHQGEEHAIVISVMRPSNKAYWG
ncbi:MAG TPA: hypothetical protein VE465_23815 [Streptosporangiaceae bacterium]|jgi:hypothetical protein|nr:hypothetical protein [Streptosporangiaceae bacterium]